VANEDLSLKRDCLASDRGAEAQQSLMTQEPEEGGAVDVFHDNGGVEENAPPLLTEEEIKH